jgi:hypothetical protein
MTNAVSKWWPLLVAMIGGGLGLLATSGTFSRMLLIVLLGLGLSWLALRESALTVAFFWVGYGLLTTVFVTTGPIGGIYYPIYLLMMVHVVRVILTRDGRGVGTLQGVGLMYTLFFTTVLLGLIWRPAQTEVDVTQRLFIYAIGGLTVFQVRSERQLKQVYLAIMLTATLVASWTILSSLSGEGDAYRGGLGVNPNYVALLIAAGIIPLLVLMAEATGRYRLLLAVPLLVGLYAEVLLASRGVFTGMTVSALVVFVRRTKWTTQVAGAGIILVLLVTGWTGLPGTDNLSSRWTEANFSDANGRLPLWTAALDRLGVVSAPELIFGGGMGESERVVRGANPFLTSMHNSWIQILTDFGLVGFLCFATILLLLLKKQPPAPRLLADTAISMVILLMVTALSMDVTDNFVCWILLGMVAASAALKEQPLKAWGQVPGKDKAIAPLIF